MNTSVLWRTLFHESRFLLRIKIRDVAKAAEKTL